MALNVMQRRILQLNAEKAAKQAALDNQLADFQEQANLAKANAAIIAISFRLCWTYVTTYPFYTKT